MMSFLQRPRLSPLVFDGRWREGRRSIPFKCCGPRWPHWRHTLSQLNQCGSLCSHLLPPGPQWAATLNAWNNDIECIMPKPSNFLSQDFRWKKNPKFIICFIFFLLKLRNQGCQEGWTSCKEMESEAFKDIVYTPRRNELLFQSGSQKTWIYFIFSFQKCKKYLKVRI